MSTRSNMYKNVTLMILFILFSIIAYFIYIYKTSFKCSIAIYAEIATNIHDTQEIHSKLPIHTDKTDVLSDPYAPPLKPNEYFHNNVQNKIPINVPTQGAVPEYRQVGILTRNTHKDTILPLFGRPLYSNRDKWQYYTMNDKSN